jgi:hypothetical protein
MRHGRLPGSRSALKPRGVRSQHGTRQRSPLTAFDGHRSGDLPGHPFRTNASRPVQCYASSCGLHQQIGVRRCLFWTRYGRRIFSADGVGQGGCYRRGRGWTPLRPPDGIGGSCCRCRHPSPAPRSVGIRSGLVRGWILSPPFLVGFSPVPTGAPTTARLLSAAQRVAQRDATTAQCTRLLGRSEDGNRRFSERERRRSLGHLVLALWVHWRTLAWSGLRYLERSRAQPCSHQP